MSYNTLEYPPSKEAIYVDFMKVSNFGLYTTVENTVIVFNTTDEAIDFYEAEMTDISNSYSTETSNLGDDGFVYIIASDIHLSTVCFVKGNVVVFLDCTSETMTFDEGDLKDLGEIVDNNIELS